MWVYLTSFTVYSGEIKKKKKALKMTSQLVILRVFFFVPLVIKINNYTLRVYKTILLVFIFGTGVIDSTSFANGMSRCDIS